MLFVCVARTSRNDMKVTETLVLACATFFKAPMVICMTSQFGHEINLLEAKPSGLDTTWNHKVHVYIPGMLLDMIAHTVWAFAGALL